MPSPSPSPSSEPVVPDARDAWLEVSGEGRVLRASAATERLLGVEPGAAAGLPLSHWLPALAGADPVGRLRHLGAEAAGAPLTLALRRADAAELCVDVAPGPGGGGGALRVRLVPLAARLAQDGDALETAPYRAVFEHAPLGLFHFDADGTLTACNDAFVRLVGSSRSALVGLRLLTLRDPGIRRAVARALAGEVAEYEGTYASQTADKHTPVHVRLAPCREPDGRVSGGVGMVEDVSARQRQDEERERLRREAHDAARVRDDFLSVASHELKTPLTPLAMRLARLERQLERGERLQPDTLRSARLQLVRMTGLINDLLDASRIAAGRLGLHRQPVALDALVERVARAHAAEHPRRPFDVALEKGGRATLRVRGDPDRLEQVLLNLLDNAVKFSPDGGAVRLRLSVHGDTALLAVSDQGVGIPPEEQPHLFERYFRARNSPVRHYGGLGLGLYISRDIVEHHDGRIWVESTPGEGSTFYVALPLLPEAQAKPPEPAPAGPEADATLH